MNKELSANTTLSHYRIASKLGAGGMGEVYQALDTRLDRQVVIKLLPADFATDQDRIRRFEQEARATSALNHPNILTVCDIGTYEGSPFIVAELLEGDELREALAERAIPPRRAIDYAKQIVAGLGAAHDKGIVHRDLKPENLFVTKDGRVKILDFGLAKLKSAKPASGSGSEDATLRVFTDPGTIMGTVGYMSPEQVRGEDADHRSDIFSFGAILYEMLAGRRAFQHETAAETMTAILKEEPRELPGNTRINIALEKIIERCLEKRPEGRFQSASDLGFALEALTSPSGDRLEPMTSSPEMTASLPASRKSRLWAAMAGLFLLALLLALPFVVGHLRRPPSWEGGVMRFAVTAPERVTRLLSPEISPDGRILVFATSSDGRLNLWLRPIDSLTAQQLPGTEGVSNPHFFSPDSRSIVFPAHGSLMKLDIGGGPAKTLCSLPRGPIELGTGGGSWSRDGVILFTSAGRIYRVSPSGGDPVLVLGSEQPEPDAYYRWPSFLPDGNHFLVFKTTVEQGMGSSAIFVASLNGKETTRLFVADSNAVYTPAAGGYLIYSRDGVLVAQSFDARALKVSGESFVLADKVTVNANGRGFFSAADSGSLVLDQARSFDVQMQLTWVDRDGKPLGPLGESGSYGPLGDQTLSPDGTRIAVARRDPKTRTRDLYVMDITRGTTSRLTFDPGEDLYPVWSPDSNRIAWASNRGGAFAIYQKLATGTGQDELLLKMDTPVSPDTWSPDGRFLVFDRSDANTRNDLWVLPVEGERKPFLFLQTPFWEGNARFSPNGRFIAYASDDQGRNEVYVQTFPASSGKWQVSTNGGYAATWRSDGRELFYVSADGKLMSVETKTGSTFEAGIPKPLFDLAPFQAIGFGGTSFAPSSDGKRFLVSRQQEGPASVQYIVVLNWATTELKK